MRIGFLTEDRQARRGQQHSQQQKPKSDPDHLQITQVKLLCADDHLIRQLTCVDSCRGLYDSVLIGKLALFLNKSDRKITNGTYYFFGFGHIGDPEHWLLCKENKILRTGLIIRSINFLDAISLGLTHVPLDLTLLLS